MKIKNAYQQLIFYLGAPLQASVFISRHKGLLHHCNSAAATYLFQVKINGANEEMLRDAAEQFAGRDMEDIRHGTLKPRCPL